MSIELGDIDRRLLDLIQRAVPLAARPFARLAELLSADEADIILRVAALSRPGGVIREIAGIFDAAAMGHASTLVGAEVPDELLEQAGLTMAAHPGVSHCYQRHGPLNLWFTLMVGPDSTLGLDGTVRVLAGLIAARRIHSFPTLRRYKLDVRFALAEEDAPSAAPPRQAAGSAAAPAPVAGSIDEREIRAIRALQTPLPAAAEPFDLIARPHGLSGEDVLAAGRSLLTRGWMRRYSAVLHHRAAGAAVNVMVAWRVPDDEADAFGARAAAVPNISHCYLRRTYPDWPYSLYTMVHAADQAQADGVIARLSQAGFPHLSLASGREFKKAKVRLFSPDLRQWEAGR